MQTKKDVRASHDRYGVWKKYVYSTPANKINVIAADMFQRLSFLMTATDTDGNLDAVIGGVELEGLCSILEDLRDAASEIMDESDRIEEGAIPTEEVV